MSSISDDDFEVDGPLTEIDTTLKSDLLDHISNVHSTGEFVTFGKIKDFENPGISVDSVGMIRLPLSDDDAKALISQSRKAPFGKGTETFVDETVRKTWEIDAAKVNLLHERWEDCLKRIVENATTELGIADEASNVRAEFYKMLLYEEGAMFKAHKDTEKVPGMFGTLVICLPSEHEGGSFHLQHREKHKVFNTSDSSRFGATYIAFYADVTHEIKPILRGRRWVLIYNLVNQSENRSPAASSLDARIEDLKNILTRWEKPESGFSFLVYPLEHQYTNIGLKSALLKGEDYHRAQHVARSCADHGEFYMLLANMYRKLRDPNQEGWYEPRSTFSFSHIVDTDGFSLNVHPSLSMPQKVLLKDISYDDRLPDKQLGGNYLGNGYSAIDQFFNDSAIVMIPKRSIRSFLLGNHPSPESLDKLIRKLEERVKMDSENPNPDLLHQICETALSFRYKSDAEKDLHLGPVAVSAVAMQDASLFARAVKQTTEGFGSTPNFELGLLICLTELHVSEDDIVEALTKSAKMHRIHENLRNFLNGSSEGNHGSADLEFTMRWLDTLAMNSLAGVETASSADASALVGLILDRSDNDFRRFVVYQAIKGFVDRFLHERDLQIALMIELLINLPESDSSQTYLEDLLRRVMESVISHFDLCFYAAYIRARDIQESRKHSYIGLPPSGHVYAGPVDTFYDRVCVHGNGTPSGLLMKFQTQAPDLSEDQLQAFLIPFLGKLVTAADPSSTEVQSCVQSLVTTYITGTVGKEPKQPRNWARPDETVYQSQVDCGCDTKLNEFLMDSEAKSHRISCENDGNLKYEFHYFRYFDEQHGADGTTTVTKTLKWWEQHHREWEYRASKALEALQKIPAVELKACLAQQYESIMDLLVVKIDNGSSENESAESI